MDGRDNAKGQKSKKWDISGIIGKFNEEKDKIGTSGCLLQKLKHQTCKGWRTRCSG